MGSPGPPGCWRRRPGHSRNSKAASGRIQHSQVAAGSIQGEVIPVTVARPPISLSTTAEQSKRQHRHIQLRWAANLRLIADLAPRVAEVAVATANAASPTVATGPAAAWRAI